MSRLDVTLMPWSAIVNPGPLGKSPGNPSLIPLFGITPSRHARCSRPESRNRCASWSDRWCGPGFRPVRTMCQFEPRRGILLLPGIPGLRDEILQARARRNFLWMTLEAVSGLATSDLTDPPVETGPYRENHHAQRAEGEDQTAARVARELANAGAR